MYAPERARCQRKRVHRRPDGRIGKVIVGQSLMIGAFWWGFWLAGHVLIEGVPGLARRFRSHGVRRHPREVFSHSVHTRLAFPADLVGTVIYIRKTEFTSKLRSDFREPGAGGRDQPRAGQGASALLEAMQEHQVTIGDKSYPLPDPSWSWRRRTRSSRRSRIPLPEAQVDRFMALIKVGVSDPRGSSARSWTA